MYIYQNIKKLRVQLGYSQEDIAKILEIKQEQYYRYESGKREIPVHKLKILAKFYGVSMDYLAE